MKRPVFLLVVLSCFLLFLSNPAVAEARRDAQQTSVRPGTILSRATDGSGNVEKPSSSVPVKVIESAGGKRFTIVPNATDWYVDCTLGNDANSCLAPGPLSACLTIQAAIDKASSFDTIHVAAGACSEPAPGPLMVNKILTILGAQSGVDARGRVPVVPAVESTITDSQGTYITANGVVIDGFTVQDSTNGAFTGYGMLMGAGTTGTKLLNNIIQDNIIGIGLANSGGSQVLIRHNQIQNNNNSGPASGTGIYTDEFVSGGALSNVLIAENTFKGNDDAGIDVSNTDAANGVSGLEISTNSFDMNGRGILLFNTHDSPIHDNKITNSTLAGSAALRLFDNNSDLDIHNNDLITGVFHGIRLSFLGVVGTPSSDLMINENNIEFFPAGDGLKVDTGSNANTVNAECNWWNSPTGPTNPGNPGGVGEKVEGDADFIPWLLAPAPGGACTVCNEFFGKVTGNGRIASPNADFGFEAKGKPGNPPKGEFHYHNHDDGVKIKGKVTKFGPPCTTDGTCVVSFEVTTKEGCQYRVTVVDNGDKKDKTDTFDLEPISGPPCPQESTGGPKTLKKGDIKCHKKDKDD